MKTIKQHVYIVLTYDEADHSRILGVYVDKEAAESRLSRSLKRNYDRSFSFHIIKKSVQGTERLVLGSNLIIERRVGDYNVS